METKVQQTEIKNHLEIDGAIITPSSSKAIAAMQAHENNEIEYFEKTIGNAICIFVGYQMQGNNKGFSSEEQETMQSLILLRDVIRNFKKP